MNTEHIGTHIASKLFSMSKDKETHVTLDEEGLAHLIQLGVRYVLSQSAYMLQEHSTRPRPRRHNSL